MSAPLIRIWASTPASRNISHASKAFSDGTSSVAEFSIILFLAAHAVRSPAEAGLVRRTVSEVQAERTRGSSCKGRAHRTIPFHRPGKGLLFDLNQANGRRAGRGGGGRWSGNPHFLGRRRMIDAVVGAGIVAAGDDMVFHIPGGDQFFDSPDRLIGTVCFDFDQSLVRGANVDRNMEFCH